MAGSPTRCKKLKGTVDSFRSDMKGDVKNLKTDDGFKNESIQRKKDCDDLEANMRRGFESEAAKMEAGFKNEENERRKV